MAFVDYEKAFDSTKRENMGNNGMQRYKAIQSMYVNTGIYGILKAETPGVGNQF